MSGGDGQRDKRPKGAGRATSQLTALLGAAAQQQAAAQHTPDANRPHEYLKLDDPPSTGTLNGAGTPSISAEETCNTAVQAAQAVQQALQALNGSHANSCIGNGERPLQSAFVVKNGQQASGNGLQTPKEQAVLARAQRELERESSLCGAAQESGGSPCKVNLGDFDILRVVGQGSFGKVFQVRHNGQQQIYAMKVMRKDRVIEQDHLEYVKAERDVLTALFHPYIVTLRFSFQTPSKLYLVLDFINGGHLFFQLYRQGAFDEDVARLYTAEMVSAISYLHSQGVVHRDLKPENVLLDGDGHIKLTDFGLAKPNMTCDEARTNSFIGTMEYMAPEIIEGNGHGKAVDWWSVGILLYEMLCGVPPFRAKSRNVLQKEILAAKPKYPKFISAPALNLLKGLLMRDANKRLGAHGSDAVKKHPFFKKIDWNKLERREIESKFKPTVKSTMSIENFDKALTDQAPEDSPCTTPTNPNFDNIFSGFSYVSPSMLAEAMDQLGVKSEE